MPTEIQCKIQNIQLSNLQQFEIKIFNTQEIITCVSRCARYLVHHCNQLSKKENHVQVLGYRRI
jgi:hypothetical protein